MAPVLVPVYVPVLVAEIKIHIHCECDNNSDNQCQDFLDVWPEICLALDYFHV